MSITDWWILPVPTHTQLFSVVALVCVPVCATQWDPLAPKLPEEAVTKCAGIISGDSMLSFSRADLLLWPCVWYVYDEPKQHAVNYCFHWEKQLGLKQRRSLSRILVCEYHPSPSSCSMTRTLSSKSTGGADLSQHTTQGCADNHSRNNAIASAQQSHWWDIPGS